MQWWIVTAVANATIFAAYLAISLAIATGLTRSQQWRSNPLGAATAATAGVGVWYWTLRSRFPALVRGAALFEDIKQRQRQALEIHDNVVQGLATAKLSFELDRRDDGMQAVEQTLAASRKIITDLLGEEGGELELRAGDFRRERAAGAPA